MKNRLLDAGARVVAFAEKLGAGQVETYLESSKATGVTLEKSSVKLASIELDTGCSVRVALGGQLGTSYVTSIQEEDLSRAAEDAVRAARSSISDTEFSSFPSCESRYPSVKGLFDKSLENAKTEQVIELLMRGVDASRESTGNERNMVEGVITSRVSTRVVVNSLGISAASRETKIDMRITSSVGVGDEQGSSSEYQTSRSLDGVDPERIGETSARNALMLRNPKTIEGGEMPLILAPQALRSVLGSGLVRALDARQVQDGKSYLLDSLGSEVASPILEVTDNAVLPGAARSRPFDAEGFPSQETPIFSSGVLLNYLHDSYSSAKHGVKNTGNAARESYSSVPRIDASNLTVSPGHGSLTDLMLEARSCVLCSDTFDVPNIVTGELSAMVMEGFLVSGGEIVHPLKNTLFGVTMRDLFKRTIMVGSDVQHRGSVVSPSVLIESVTITSG